MALTADRLFVLLLALLGAVGPGLAERSARLLDPALCVALAWEERGVAGALVVAEAGPVRVDGRLVADPWGFPFRWEEQAAWPRPAPPPPVTRWGRTIFGCRVPLAFACSFGPDGERSTDDVVVKDAADWPTWQRLAAGSPWAVTVVLVAYLALAWPVLRSRTRGGLVDAGIAALVVLPLAPVAVVLGATDAMTRLTAGSPVVIPASYAVPVSLWVLALLLAFAVRVSPRPARDTAGA